MRAQNLDANGVESAEPGHALDHPADQMADPLLHLAGGLVGKGDAQDLTGPGTPGREDVSKPGGKHPGLAGPGASEHEERPVRRLDRSALLRIEALEIRRLGAGERAR